MNANLFSTNVQQLLAAIQPQLFSQLQHQKHRSLASPTCTSRRRHSLSTSPSPNFLQQATGSSRVQTPKHSPIRNSCSSASSNFSHNHYEKSIGSQQSISASSSTAGSGNAIGSHQLLSTQPSHATTTNGRAMTPSHHHSPANSIGNGNIREHSPSAIAINRLISLLTITIIIIIIVRFSLISRPHLTNHVLYWVCVCERAVHVDTAKRIVFISLRSSFYFPVGGCSCTILSSLSLLIIVCVCVH